MQLLWRTVWRFLKKPKIELPYDLAIPFWGIYPEKMKMQIEKDESSISKICTPVFTEALFTIAKTQKQPKCPLSDE